MSGYSKFMDSDFALMEQLRDKTPGTLKHSQNVMNMCESIAIELNLNKDLLKCSALYHDVGKIFNPEYFSENQDDSNPHDNINAKESYEIITRHVSDSCLLMVQYGFPMDVIKTVSCHHGNSVLLHFWNKTKKKKNNEITKNKFRYKSSTPKDTESIVLMICDRVEAQSKSLFTSGKLKDEQARCKIVDEIVEELINDDQIDNLTYGTGKIIKKILKSELKSIYHERVKYEESMVDSVSKEDMKNIVEGEF